jgi:hypothetical protein
MTDDERYEALLAAYDPTDRVADCPDPDSSCLQRIEVEFAIPVEMTQDEQRRLVLLLDEIVSSPWNQVKEGVHWLSGMGSKPNWSQADAAFLGIQAVAGALPHGEPTFDDSVYQIVTCARSFLSDKERDRKLKRREQPEMQPDEKRLVQTVVEALESVAFFWDNDPEAFGDKATLGTIARRFGPVAQKCRRALALLWEREAKRDEPEPEANEQ